MELKSTDKLKFDVAESNIVEMGSAESVTGKIKIVGENNSINIMAGSVFKGDISIAGKNNYVSIGEKSTFRGQLLIKGNNQRVVIGEGTTFQSVYILCQEGCNVEIGRWCMFSRGIEIRTTDAHSVVDVVTGDRLNIPSSVRIGDHVWVSVGAMISKGASIPEDSIVGAFAFVNRVFQESHTVIAGAPAKVMKTGVTWNRSRKVKFTEDELNFWKKSS